MKSRRRIVSPWIETMPKFGFGLHITDHRPSIVLRRGPIGRALTVMRLQRLDRGKAMLIPKLAHIRCGCRSTRISASSSEIASKREETCRILQVAQIGFFWGADETLAEGDYYVGVGSGPAK